MTKINFSDLNLSSSNQATFKFFDFSVLGKINGILGGILGTVKGVIIACIFCTVIALIVSFTENGFWIFNNENIDKTIIFKLLANIF